MAVQLLVHKRSPASGGRGRSFRRARGVRSALEQLFRVLSLLCLVYIGHLSILPKVLPRHVPARVQGVRCRLIWVPGQALVGGKAANRVYFILPSQIPEDFGSGHGVACVPH